jgi:hypothetical protein
MLPPQARPTQPRGWCDDLEDNVVGLVSGDICGRGYAVDDVG